MAKVKYPLNSLSASGSISNVITYAPVADQQGREIDRVRDFAPIRAIYPPRIISGQGIAKLKIDRRPDLKGGTISTSPRRALSQADRVSLFKTAKIISDWMVSNNIAVQTSKPLADGSDGEPVHHGYLRGRADNREQRKFPGQGTGTSTSFRRNIVSPKSGHTYLMHLLLTRNYRRFVITELFWSAFGRNYSTLFSPNGDAPYSDLPDFFILPIIGRVNHVFINIWIQLACLVPSFALGRNWFALGTGFGLWQHPRTLASAISANPDYQTFISAQNDSKTIHQQPWVSAP